MNSPSKNSSKRYILCHFRFTNLHLLPSSASLTYKKVWIDISSPLGWMHRSTFSLTALLIHNIECYLQTRKTVQEKPCQGKVAHDQTAVLLAYTSRKTCSHFFMRTSEIFKKFIKKTRVQAALIFQAHNYRTEKNSLNVQCLQQRQVGEYPSRKLLNFVKIEIPK